MCKKIVITRRRVQELSNQPYKRIEAAVAIIIIIISTYLCEFYSIPNSPRGGERENGSTLLQTVLH